MTTVKKISSIACVILFAFVTTAQSQSPGTFGAAEARSAEHAIDSILAGLTLQEKIGQLVQYTGDWDTGPAGARINASQQQLIKEGKVGSLFNVIGSATTRGLQKIAVEQSRARIPLIFGLDVIHGFRTTFPIPLGEAATWDPEAVELSSRVSASEAASAGIHWTFAPMVDIARDPRWGRIAEGSGEDPYLGAIMAAARVRGFQGSGLGDPASIVACAKHYAAYGAAEGGRDYNTVDMSEQTLRDVYLPPFKAALDAGVGTFMASFNEINGVPSSGSRLLLTSILRDEWKFNGFVVSDWTSISEMIPHGFAADSAHAAELAINAGVDMDMESSCYRLNLQSLVEKGKVTTPTIDEAVRRILRIKFRLGLFADPYRSCSPERESREIRKPANVTAARQVARKSLVLLKNEGGILPLGKDAKTIALIGPLAHNRRDPIGPWAGPTDTSDVVTVLEGVRAAAPSARVLFAPGCSLNGTDTVGFAEALAVARGADVVLMVMGESREMSGEAGCRASLELPGRQRDLLMAVHATGRPVVLILMNGRPLALSWEAAHVRAILETWFAGCEAGNAIADVLFGSFLPSGRLPATFPRASGQVPYYYNHKNTGRPPNDTEHYTSRYIDVSSSPLFPFGFGLTYTTFAYSNLEVLTPRVKPADSIRIHVIVKNTGARTGEEVVQLYVRDDVGSLTRPVRELKGYTRIRLAPGESLKVPMRVAVSDLAFTGGDLKRGVEPGTFTLYVGPNAQEGLTGKFEVLK